MNTLRFPNLVGPKAPPRERPREDGGGGPKAGLPPGGALGRCWGAPGDIPGVGGGAGGALPALLLGAVGVAVQPRQRLPAPVDGVGGAVLQPRLQHLLQQLLRAVLGLLRLAGGEAALHVFLHGLRPILGLAVVLLGAVLLGKARVRQHEGSLREAELQAARAGGLLHSVPQLLPLLGFGAGALGVGVRGVCSSGAGLGRAPPTSLGLSPPRAHRVGLGGLGRGGGGGHLGLGAVVGRSIIQTRNGRLLVEAALLPRGGGLLGGGPISARGAIRGCSTVPRIHILHGVVVVVWVGVAVGLVPLVIGLLLLQRCGVALC